MKILHYTLGFAPERSGGLVRYATDLMTEQVRQGDQVLALYPGKYRRFQISPSIRKGKALDFHSYQLVNSLPLPVFGGISQPHAFMTEAPIQVYQQFLEQEKPDIFHLHTLMGLHRECLEAARSLGIKIVMTSHDYFGLAPVPSFYAQNRSFVGDQSNMAWQFMSAGALSVKKLRLFQSSFYPCLRQFARCFQIIKPDSGTTQNLNLAQHDYTSLQAYYQSMFDMVDAFHFNSQLAKAVFESHLDHQPAISKVLTISHADIRPAIVRQAWANPVRIAYIGPNTVHKGYDVFIDLAKKWQNKQDGFSWQTWGHDPKPDVPGFIDQRGRFSSSNLAKIYQELDVLIVPSQWSETFGFIVLEALSYGKMVLVSKEVGSKELLPSEWVFDSTDDLDNLLEHLTQPEGVLPVKTLLEHVWELSAFYRDTLEKRESL